MTTTRSPRHLGFLLAALLGTGAAIVGPVLPASADIDDLTTCVDPTHGSTCGDDTPLDGPDDFTSGGDGPDDPGPELPEAQPEPGDGELPPAEVDGTVVAQPTFTG